MTLTACATPPNDETLVMSWSEKSVPGSKSEQLKVACIFLAPGVFLATLVTVAGWRLISSHPDTYRLLLTWVAILTACMIMLARQRTLYTYRIYRSSAQLEYSKYYPAWAPTFFKSFGVVALGLLALSGLIAGSFMFFMGPVAMAAVAGLRLVSWKNPISREKSLSWNDYDSVTIDRGQRVIVTHVKDLTWGFEARLPDDGTLEAYLGFLKTALPSTAKFVERRWELSNI
jgi:hypothetical protein